MIIILAIDLQQVMSLAEPNLSIYVPKRLLTESPKPFRRGEFGRILKVMFVVLPAQQITPQYNFFSTHV